MKINNLKNDLLWRGLLKDVTNEDSFAKIVESEGKFYVGIDPTADSLHIGHYLSLSLTKILFEHGLKPVIVLGGFTGMIGDPSGRNSEREVVNREVIKENVIKISAQVTDLLNKLGIENVEIVDNTIFYDEMSIIDIYQNYGKLFNINTMLSKESVKNRIDNGISYTEFSYQMFQAIDFLKLYEKHGVTLQLGGSDQWGNIVAGTELIRKIHGAEVEVAGATINLLTDENGNKIGKTQGVPMWVDKNKTTPYTLFQYLINLTDETAKKLLSQATNITEAEYSDVLKQQEEAPQSKAIQNELAKRLITAIHSSEDFEQSKELSKLLFEERYQDINLEQIDSLKNIPSLNNEDELLMDLLIKNEKINSRREYRELLANGAVKINGTSIDDENIKLTNEFLQDKVVFINLGKKNKYIIWK